MESKLVQNHVNLKINPINDGVDHIRVDSTARTHLGRTLNAEYHRVFFYPGYGSFTSIGSCIHYLRLKKKDEKIRYLRGSELKYYIKDQIESGQNEFLEGNDFHTVNLPKEVINNAVFYSIMSHANVLELFLTNKLPLVPYFINDKTGTVNIRDDYLIDALAFIHLELKSNPNLMSAF